MSDSITTQVCRICGEEKPLTEFYVKLNPRSKTHWKICKLCWIERSRARHRDVGRNQSAGSRIFPSTKQEGDVITILHSLGIWATPGKASIFPHVDVVAWGCVRIEVKSAALNYKDCFSFRFSARQVREGVKADLIVLMLIRDNNETFHVFPASHPVFYNQNGLRSSVAYIPRRRPGYQKLDYWLTAELLDEQQDAWHLIEQCRLDFANRLQLGHDIM